MHWGGKEGDPHLQLLRNTAERSSRSVGSTPTLDDGNAPAGAYVTTAPNSP